MKYLIITNLRSGRFYDAEILGPVLEENVERIVAITEAYPREDKTLGIFESIPEITTHLAETYPNEFDPKYMEYMGEHLVNIASKEPDSFHKFHITAIPQDIPDTLLKSLKEITKSNPDKIIFKTKDDFEPNKPINRMNPPKFGGEYDN